MSIQFTYVYIYMALAFHTCCQLACICKDIWKYIHQLLVAVTFGMSDLGIIIFLSLTFSTLIRHRV